MSHTHSLENRRFLVTGGSAGIGLAITKALREAGARVAIMARTEGRLQATAEHLDVHPIVGDVGKEEDCIRSVAEAVKVLGGLDGLINNAAVHYRKPVEAIEAQPFRRLLEINVIGAALMAREAVPHMKVAGSGDIVNLASTSGLRGGAGGSVYGASKFALRGMTQCWQAELRKDDIRVILVNPSEVQTAMTGSGPDAPKNAHKLFAQDIAHAVVSALEMHRRGFIPELTVFATNPWRKD